MNGPCVRVGATALAAGALVYGTAALIAAADAAKTPLIVSFADLKWAALPERPGTQFAVLSARRLGAREWLPRGKRMRLLPGRQGEVRLQAQRKVARTISCGADIS
jgi:hypothetical protein